MILTLNIYTLFEVLAVLQGLIFTALLIRRAWFQERYSDYWLAALLFVFSVYLSRYILNDIDANDSQSFLPRILRFSFYVIGVVIYFYLKCQLNARYRLSRKNLWHFLPVLIYIILFFINSVQTYRHGVSWERPFVFQIMTVFFLIYRSVGTSVYWVLSWQLYKKYCLWLPTERSDTEGVKFRWFRHVLIALGVMVFSGITLNLFDNFIYTTPFWIDTAQSLLVAFGIYYLSLSGYLQYQPQQLIYEESDEKKVEKKVENSVENSVENAGGNSVNTPDTLSLKMPDNEMAEWKNKILLLMNQDKLYLNPELTLTDFAQRLNTHSKRISVVINAAFDKNFNDFVNEYRVNLFKEKVNDPKLKHLTLLAIAFECGFNSKSTFNRAVKRATGEMPSTFVESILNT